MNIDIKQPTTNPTHTQPTITEPTPTTHNPLSHNQPSNHQPTHTTYYHRTNTNNTQPTIQQPTQHHQSPTHNPLSHNQPSNHQPQHTTTYSTTNHHRPTHGTAPPYANIEHTRAAHNARRLQGCFTTRNLELPFRTCATRNSQKWQKNGKWVLRRRIRGACGFGSPGFRQI